MKRITVKDSLPFERPYRSTASKMVALLSPNPSDGGTYDDPEGWTEGSGSLPMLRRRSTRIWLTLLGAAVILVGLASSGSLQRFAPKEGLLEYQGSRLLDHGTGKESYYAPSASALPPALSTLPAAFRRITLISVWASNARPSYLNNFFRSAALNAASADLLVIHITDDYSKCLDGRNEFGKKDGIIRDAAWDWEKGGNIRVVCLSREAYLAHEANYLCSEAGWNCDDKDHKAVVRSNTNYRRQKAWSDV